MDSCFVMRHASTNLLRADSNEFVIGNNKPKLSCQLKKKGGVSCEESHSSGAKCIGFQCVQGQREVTFSSEATWEPKCSWFATIVRTAKCSSAPKLPVTPSGAASWLLRAMLSSSTHNRPKLIERHTNQKFWGTFLETDVPKETEQVCFSKNTKLMKSSLRLCSMLDEVSFWVTKKLKKLQKRKKESSSVRAVVTC